MTELPTSTFPLGGGAELSRRRGPAAAWQAASLLLPPLGTSGPGGNLSIHTHPALMLLLHALMLLHAQRNRMPKEED